MSQDLSKYIEISKDTYNVVKGADWPDYETFLKSSNISPFILKELNKLLWNDGIKSKTFCVLPFYNIEYPANTVCCLLPQTYDINSIKKDMLDNVRSKFCKSCWSLEDIGYISDRMLKNSLSEFLLDKDLKVIENDCRKNKNSTVHYKIDTNNTCNATCITCNGHFSSSWIKLENNNNYFNNKLWNFSIDDVNIDYKNAKSITFRGGESLLGKVNFQILERLLDNNNKECFISFVTNGSVSLSKNQIKLLSKFENKNFCLSIDGIEKVFEYLRYPLSWGKLTSNIEQFKESKIPLSVSYTISNLNIMYHSQTLDWFIKNEIPFHQNVVTSPEYFQPSNLPIEVKKLIKDSNNINFLKDHQEFDNNNFQQFIIKMKEQDQWKKISIADYLPELSKLLQPYM
jgi:hypothetical protein